MLGGRGMAVDINQINDVSWKVVFPRFSFRGGN